MRYLGENLRWLIKQKGLRNKDVAAHFGWKPQVISSYITHASSPPLDKLLELADYFDVTLDDFVNKNLTKEGESDVDPAFIDLVKNKLNELSRELKDQGAAIQRIDNEMLARIKAKEDEKS